MKNWFINLSNGIKVLIHIINAIIFIAIPIAIEGTTNVPLILLWVVNMVFGIIFIVWHVKSNKMEKEYVQTEEGQAKEENAEKLLKIAKANRVNPYVDVTPFVLDYGFPFVDYNGFFCSDGEIIVYACPANVFKDKEQVVGYRGRSTGASVRVAKGLYMRSGRSGSSAVRAEVRKYYNGDLIVTNKRVVFIGKDESFECPIEKITATKLLTKSSFILQYGRTSKNISVDINTTEYAYGMINYVTKAYKDGEDVCVGIKQSYDDMTEEQKALCVRIKNETAQLKIPKSAINSEGSTPTAVKVIFAAIVIIFVGLIVSAIVAGSINSNKEPEHTPIESFALDYKYYDENITLVLGDNSGFMDYGDWDTLLFYVKPSNVELEDIEIVNSNNEVLRCWIDKSLNDPETHSLKVIVGYEGLKVGESTFHLKDKNSAARSCDITIKVEEKEEEVDNSRTVYVNYSGDKYHYSKSCAGNSAYETTLNKAKASYKEPCSKCAH